MKIMKQKKGQEEMMGFVLIVLVIVIMGLVFFAFSARKHGDSVWQKSSETDDLLSSMLAYTTDCRVSGSNISIKELIRACSESPKDVCRNTQENVCEKANKTLNEMLSALNINVADKPIHGYNLTVATSDNDNEVPLPIMVSIGNQTGNSFVSSASIPGRPPFFRETEISMKCWYSKTSQ